MNTASTRLAAVAVRTVGVPDSKDKRVAFPIGFDHVIVLMRDNLLGWLYDGESSPRDQNFEGLHSNLWSPLDNIDSDIDSDRLPFTRSPKKVYDRKNDLLGSAATPPSTATATRDLPEQPEGRPTIPQK